MAKTDYAQRLDEVTFRCPGCGAVFSAAPGRVEDYPERDWHPWRYFADCACGDEARQVGWEVALLKAWQNATGPKTAEGLAATSANLEGHPTPEEARRTRFNGMKHGLSSRVATYFPAKPDGYAHCATCDVERDWCRAQPCCMKQTALFMKFQAAFERKDPNLLADLFADQQAGLFAIVQQLMVTILAEGGMVKTPRVHVSKEGEVTMIRVLDEKGVERQVYDVEAHPLLRVLAEFVSRANLNLADMGMTPRAADQEASTLGRLQHEKVEQEGREEFQAKVSATLDALAPLLERAKLRKQADPVLLEHHRQVGESP